MAYMTNTDEETFGTLAADASNVTVSHASVILDYGVASSGARGELLLWTGALAAPRTFVADDPIVLPAGALDFNLPNGALNDAAVLAAYRALLAGKTGGATISLGTAAMGNDGQQNEVSASGYSRQVMAITSALGTAP